MKTVGAAGLGSVVAGCKGEKEKEPDAVDANAAGEPQGPEFAQVPRRELGKSGVKVPCLCLGGNYDLVGRQIILRKALDSGVNYWDTAHNYAGGNSEVGIGKFLSKNPDARKKLFITSKASFARTAESVEGRLYLSLKRMNTNYIDLYYGVHFLSDPSQLTDELKNWAESAKQRKMIRFLGFSIHQNTARCLAAAAKLDWIDVIMMVYNFRLMQDAKMQAAIEACHKAGIALIAMKTQAAGPDARLGGHAVKVETKEDKKLVGHFQKQGFTEGQAKIKVVLEDERFSSVCVGMENINLLNSNVAAVRNKTRLTDEDKEVFKEYARATCRGYCAGCAYICDSALRKSARGRLTAESIVRKDSQGGLPDASYVSDIMRYLMYYNSYGEQDRARELFAQIPGKVRNRLLSTDYKPAEARCPQRLPIGKLVAEAVSKLT